MKRQLLVGAVLAALTLLSVTDMAHAQRRGFGGRMGGGWGGGGWGGSGFGIGIGNYGYGNYGYGSGYGYGYPGYSSYYYPSSSYYSPGYYGNNYYGNNWHWGTNSAPYGDNGYYSTPNYTYDQNVAPDINYAQGSVNANQAFYNGPQDNSATIRIMVPDPNASVAVDGQQTAQRGTQRTFTTPPLQPGERYNYDIQATWNQGGRPVTVNRRVSFQAGQTVPVAFNNDQANQNVQPTDVQQAPIDGQQPVNPNLRPRDNAPINQNNPGVNPNGTINQVNPATQPVNPTGPRNGAPINQNNPAPGVNPNQVNPAQQPATTPRGNLGQTPQLQPSVQPNPTPGREPAPRVPAPRDVQPQQQ